MSAAAMALEIEVSLAARFIRYFRPSDGSLWLLIKEVLSAKWLPLEWFPLVNGSYWLILEWLLLVSHWLSRRMSRENFSS